MLTAWAGVVGSSERGKKWLDSGFVLKVEPREWMVFKAETTRAPKERTIEKRSQDQVLTCSNV